MPPKIHQKLPTQWAAREELREKGQFWTPEWVAKAMMQYAIGGGATSVLDPATGNGAFLLAWEQLCAHKARCPFVGFDIDASVLNRETYSKPYCTVEMRDFIHSPPLKAFPAIVANPPYIRHHRLSKDTKKRLRQIAVDVFGFTLDGRAGIHIYFLIQALSMLAPSGRLAFIMPADTCEGVFSDKLWKWIASQYRLDSVITFDHEATPFPGVDTNAVVFMIQNRTPKDQVAWVRCHRADSDDLFEFVKSGFRRNRLEHLTIVRRDLKEALNTGLSRPQHLTEARFTLGDFASVMRGIATGANDFFWLTRNQAREAGIPDCMLKVAIGRTRDIGGDVVTAKDIDELDRQGRPTLLFCPDGRELHEFPKTVQRYIEQGEERGFAERSLIKSRRPWYKMERREVPPFLFAYLGRRNVRFIRNDANAVPLTGFLCVYPHAPLRAKTSELWDILNDAETIANLSLVGKSYGSGAIKVEPRNLERLPIPDRLVKRLGAHPNKRDRHGNLLLFESEKEYLPKKRC